MEFSLDIDLEDKINLIPTLENFSVWKTIKRILRNSSRNQSTNIKSALNYRTISGKLTV